MVEDEPTANRHCPITRSETRDSTRPQSAVDNSPQEKKKRCVMLELEESEDDGSFLHHFRKELRATAVSERSVECSLSIEDVIPEITPTVAERTLSLNIRFPLRSRRISL
uniref:Uncharacterized protein n=1 Tax=Arundo donax TaxID=35708 RepID=A0A0A9G1P5_ARUDO